MLAVICFLIYHCQSVSQSVSHKWINHVGQSVTCLTADPGVASLFPARSRTFAEIDREIISMAILLPSTDSRRVVVSYKRKYVHEVLVSHLAKLTQEKTCG